MYAVSTYIRVCVERAALVIPTEDVSRVETQSTQSGKVEKER